jgi:hypothetical protein
LFENPLKKISERIGGKKAENVQEKSQLVRIFSDLKESRDVLDFVAKQIFEKQKGQFKSEKEVKQLFKEAGDKQKAFGLARLIEESLGEGTLRVLSFTSKGVDAERNVLKILRKNLEKESFEKKAERGLYLGILENYDVSWNLEKAARDAWQNFFDANGQTLDGVKIEAAETKAEKEEENSARLKITGEQDYDWRELVHIGATTKKESVTSAGGFGEGAKILALVLLRDHGAKEVKFSSRDWEINYYLDKVPEETYYKEVRGLFVKKRKRPAEKGSAFEVTFVGEDAEKNLKVFESAQDFFYSSKNPDFQGPSFDNKKTGGFKILPPNDKGYPRRNKGHLYIAGQRMHFEIKDTWDTVEDLNIWTYEKIVPKDRDRGMVTRDEMREKIIPFIADSMSVADAKKSVYDFEHLWVKDWWGFEVSYRLLERIVDNLEKAGEKLKFEKEYLASDIIFGDQWIVDVLRNEGYKICPRFMSKIGMIKVSEQFKELQSHYKVEALPAETEKILLLQKVAKKVGLSEEELKEVWLFSAADERSIFHGQYNDMFYWMAKESLNGEFLDALHTYVHEAAHKAGPHGNPKFEYRLQELIKGIQKLILSQPELFKESEKEWQRLNKEIAKQANAK